MQALTLQGKCVGHSSSSQTGRLRNPRKGTDSTSLFTRNGALLFSFWQKDRPAARSNKKTKEMGLVNIMPDSCAVTSLMRSDTEEEDPHRTVAGMLKRTPSQDSCEDRQAVLRASIFGDLDDDFNLFTMPGEVGRKLSTVHETTEMAG